MNYLNVTKYPCNCKRIWEKVDEAECVKESF